MIPPTRADRESALARQERLEELATRRHEYIARLEAELAAAKERNTSLCGLLQKAQDRVDMLENSAQTARREALEEAAQRAEAGGTAISQDIARSIRALLDKEPPA